MSIDIDDNCKPDHDWWVQQGNRLGWKFTWFVIGSYIDAGSAPFYGTWADFRGLFALGHDVQSHSYDHSLIDLTRPPAAVDLSYRRGKEVIEANVPGNKVVTLAYPGGDGIPDIAAQYCIAARGTGGVPNIANRTWYMYTNTGVRPVEFIGQVDQILDPSDEYWRGWLSPYFHNIVGAEALDKQAVIADMEGVSITLKARKEISGLVPSLPSPGTARSATPIPLQ
jgi:hypothetical protein